MKAMISKAIKKIIYPHKYSSEVYIKHLRSKGAKIGNNCQFYAPILTYVDVSRAFLLSIGDNTSITQGVIILNHDYSYSVLNDIYKVMPNPCKETRIGRNCFIGMNAIILSGAEIGDNCIIGAGAVVAGKFDSNSVICGNPAKVICTLEKYKDKKVKGFDKSAKLYAIKFKEANHRWPTVSEMGVYIQLFLPRTEESRQYFLNLKSRMYNVSENLFEAKPSYGSYEEFLDSIEHDNV